ncbi:MAG: non-ribosomal peptide synthetase [Alphaproteobacteria bacterium]|nr:non-ribosomal peptide synthetase [Alphaproteobacteria bacterium]
MYEIVRYWADTTPDAPAIAASGLSPLTYHGLLGVIDEIGGALSASGLGRGNRVAIVHSGGAGMAAAIMGISSYATAVPLNPKLTAGEFAVYLHSLGVVAVAIEQGSGDAVRRAADKLGLAVLEIEAVPGPVAGKVRLRGSPAGLPRHFGPAEPDDVAVVLSTSGTTSASKLVPVKHHQMIARGEDTAARFGLRQTDRVLNMMPMFHIGGLGAGLHYLLFSGAATIPVPRLDVPTIFDYLAEFQPTFLMGTYTIYHAISAQADRFEETIASASPHIRVIRSGTGRLETRIGRALETLFDAPVIQAYGSSETGFMAAEPLPPKARKAGSVGLTAGTEVRILDDTGARLGPDQRGEVVVRGPMIFDGYDDASEANRTAFSKGWFRTGDQGYFDSDGYLFLTGRLKEMINRGGQKITPNEIDDALLAHPGVQAAAAFPVPHSTLGEEIAAAVVLEPGVALAEETLSRFLRGRLATFKVPRRLLFVDEIPKGPTGKVQRYKLAAAFDLVRSAGPDQCRDSLESQAPTALESKLQDLWAQSLDVKTVGLHDNFFLLGGDSLQAIDLFMLIEEALGHRLPRAILFEAGTVAEMAKRIEADLPSQCLVPIQPEGERPPFFCIHDQNGHVLNFRDLARYLGPAQPFYGIQAVGLDGKSMPFTRMDDMVAQYVRDIRKIQPVGPYYIGGYSFGGRVAYAMAQHLRAEGETVALLALLDTYYLDGRKFAGIRHWLNRHRDRIAKLRLLEIPSYFASRIRALAEIVESVHRSNLLPAAWRFFERRGRPVPRFLWHLAAANDAIRRSDCPQPYDGDAVLFKAELPALKHTDIHAGWHKLIKGRLEIKPVPGQHFDFIMEPHVHTLAAELSACLSQVQDRLTPQAKRRTAAG